MDDGDAPTTDTTDERGSLGPRRPAAKPSPRYVMGAELGHGGMGEVLVARDDQIGREVAIKRMKQREPSVRAVARFLREAKIQARLEHPAIVPVHEIGIDDDGLPFFAMKRLAGTTLETIIDDTPEPEYSHQRLLGAFVDVCLAIEFAHTRGVIHRDIKPANIMLGDFGEVYVLDWGVAKVATHADVEEVDARVSGEALATMAGSMIGTPDYMSPEQFAGEPVDPRTDIYALGCVLFEILTRTPLIRSTDDRFQPARPSQRAPERDIPPELDALCSAATAPDPEARPRSARLLADAIQAFLDGDRDIARRRAFARHALDLAEAAFADRAHEHARRTALREAGRALALDPTMTAASGLIARLIIEPPPTTPPEVEAAIEEDDRLQFRRFGRIAMTSALAYLPFIPMWMWIAPTVNVVVLVASIVANVAVAFAASRDITVPAPLAWGVRASIVAALAWSFSPLFLAPSLAAVFAMSLALDPRITRPVSAAGLVVLLSFGVLGPAVAEHFGWLPETIAIGAAGVTFSSPGIERMSQWFLAGYAVVLIATAVYIAFSIATGARAARRQLQVQAWQLRQLVSD